jgi:hypothetical protein
LTYCELIQTKDVSVSDDKAASFGLAWRARKTARRVERIMTVIAVKAELVTIRCQGSANFCDFVLITVGMTITIKRESVQIMRQV